MTLSTFKKSLWLGMLAGITLLWLPPAEATKGPQGVSNTTHNFAYNASQTPTLSYLSKTEDEVCIYCHTPHGGNLEGALWNKPFAGEGADLQSANYFTHYNSATLSSAAKGSGLKRPLNNESLLCMGCHDGTVAINRVVNVSNRTVKDLAEPDALIENRLGGVAQMQAAGSTEPGAWIGASSSTLAALDWTGGHLDDDHPVSFDYVQSFGQKPAGSMHTKGEAELKGVRFFPAGGSGTRLECSSCHDPHVDYNTAPAYTPFLITSNTASALCLACHIK